MTPEQKIVQYLAEVHALEAALVQTLTAHIAMTPRSEYRELLERHLDETRDQTERILERLAELGESRNPLQLVYGLAQTAIGQVIAAGKFPLDLVRGTGGEEKLLKNARDEAASEALEIATYDSIEAFADAAGDERTATLAREHREQELAMLDGLRELIPQLARDVFESEIGEDGSYELSTTGAADAARGVARIGRSTAGRAGQTAGDVQAAARAAASDVRRSASRLRDVAEDSAEDAAARVTRQTQETAGRIAAAARRGGDDEAGDRSAPEDDAPAEREAGGAGEQQADGADLPIEGYEKLTVERILPKLRLLTAAQLQTVEAFERRHRNRKRVLDRVARLRTTGGAPAPARR